MFEIQIKKGGKFRTVKSCYKKKTAIRLYGKYTNSYLFNQGIRLQENGKTLYSASKYYWNNIGSNDWKYRYINK